MTEEPNLLQAKTDGTVQDDNSHVGLEEFSDSELIIGLVGAVGTELKKVSGILKDRLETGKYEVKEIRISTDIIPLVTKPRAQPPSSEFQRIDWAMDDGDDARERSGENSILALGAASKISALRNKDAEGHPQVARRRAYILNSLKHPEEVFRLREIYPLGFYLVGVHSDPKRRSTYLKEEFGMTPSQVRHLMKRDEDEKLDHGQRVTDTFHLSDFFVRVESDHDRLKHSLWRFLDILFGDPYRTPTFDEYAMFMAFATSMRSADMSRQVGAVIANQNEILSSGANDCPQFGGGLYWPEYQDDTKKIEDKPRGRDYKHGRDLNKVEQQDIISKILRSAAKKGIDPEVLRPILKTSRIKDLTEFGRAVHAEMEALLACARNRNNSRGATLYCTTFPCHNCAKHIIAAGIYRVVYIEPYVKSRAAILHKDAMVVGFAPAGKKVVRFEPFVGVGPRHFMDVFSMKIGSGYFLEREDRNSNAVRWHLDGQSKLRLQMLPSSYLDVELKASSMFFNKTRRKEKANGN